MRRWYGRGGWMSSKFLFLLGISRQKKSPAGEAGRLRSFELLSGWKQPREPRESHPRKLLTAAPSYSQTWSRITSISVGIGPCELA